MRATVVSLAAERRRRALPPRDRLSAQAEVRGGLVIMLARDREVAMTPAAGRSWANRFIGLCDQADGVPRPPELGEAELRARLALLGDAVARYEAGERRASDAAALVALTRQLTAEVRR
jgi:hypothetical protein